MSYRLIQSKELPRAAVLSSDLGFDVDVTAGSLLVIATSVWDATVSSVAWVTGGSATPALAVNTSVGVTARLRIFYVENASAGPHTVRVSLSATSDVTVAIAEYAGIVTSGALDQTQAQNSSTDATTITSTATATLAQARNLVLSITNHDFNGAPTIQSSDLHGREVDPVNNGFMCIALADKRSQSTAGVTATWNYGTNVPWRVAVAVFKEATSSDPDEPVLVACGTAASAASGNITPANPTHVAGDVLLLKVHSSDNIAHSVTGWTQIDQHNNGTAQRVSTWWFRATGAGTTNPTVTHTGGGSVIGQVDVWRNCIASGDPVRTSSWTNSGGTNDFILDSTALSGLSLNDAIVFAGFYEDDPQLATQPISWVAPTNGVQTTSSGNDSGLYTRYKRQEAAGASDAPSVTVSTGAGLGASPHVVGLIALVPVAGGGGTTLTVSIGGTLTSAGTLVRQGRRNNLAGTMATAGALVKQGRRNNLAGTLATTGALAKQGRRNLSGTLTSAGAIAAARIVLLLLLGTLTAFGTLVKQSRRAVGGTLATAGNLVKQLQRTLTSTLTTAGMLVRQGRRTLAGTLTTAGAISSSIGARTLLVSIGGTLATAGSLVKQGRRALAGTLTTSGALVKQDRKVLAGTLVTIGAIARQGRKVLAGVLATAGAITAYRGFIGEDGSFTTLGTLLTVSLSGTLTTAGTLVKSRQKVLTGTLATAGALIKQGRKALAGALTTAGSITAYRGFIGGDGSFTTLGTLGSVSLSGILTTAGALVRQGRKALAGLLATVGLLSKQDRRAIGGTASFTGAISPSSARLIATAGTLSVSGSIASIPQRSINVGGILSFSGTVLTSTTTAAAETAPEYTLVSITAPPEATLYAAETPPEGSSIVPLGPPEYGLR